MFSLIDNFLNKTSSYQIEDNILETNKIEEITKFQNSEFSIYVDLKTVEYKFKIKSLKVA